MKFFGSLDRFFYWVGQNGLMNSDAGLQCQLRAPIDNHTFTTSGDGLVSFIRLLGNRQIVGDEEFESACADFSGKLKSYLSIGNGRQHSFSFGCLTDASSAERFTANLIKPIYETGRRYGVESPALFRDIHQCLAANTQEDIVVLVVQTHVDGLTKDERARMARWRQEAAKKYAKHGTFDEVIVQTPEFNGPTLIPRHQQLVKVLCKDLENPNGRIGILADVMHVDEVGRMLYGFANRDPLPASTSGRSGPWRLRYLGDTLAGPLARRKDDMSNHFPLSIGRQIYSAPIPEIFGDIEMSKYGSWYYASIVMEMPPEQSPTPTFQELDRFLGRTVPWSAHFELLPNGMDFNKSEQMMNSLLGGFGDNNKRMRAAYQELRDLQINGEYVAALRVVFRTWAKTQDKLAERMSFLKLAVQGWGSSVVTNETGAPGLAMMSSIPGFTKRSVAPYMPGPLSEVIRMMPISRSASVWKDGGLILRTEDGQPYPIRFGSTLQTYSGCLVFAPPGFGKSLLVNCINRGNTFAPGIEELPYITIADVGMSSTGIVNLLKSYLPKHLADQVISIRVRNSVDYAVNPFDTQLGCDRPTENHRDYLVAVVSTVSPNLGDDTAKFCGAVIDEAYEYYGRTSPNAKRFQTSFNQRITAAIEEIGFVPDQHTTVWEVIDALMDAGRVADAWIAHRYAMPTLGNLTTLVGRPKIVDLYGNAKHKEEKITSIFQRNIMIATSEYQMISTHTRFDTGDARIVAIDLEEIVGSAKSAEGKRKAAVMYQFARQLGAGNYFMRWEEMEKLVPERYRAYHQQRVQQMWQSVKYMIYDEYHNASGIEELQQLVCADLRQGRKYQVVAMLSSQYLEDFPKQVCDAANTYFILGTGSETSLTEVQERFGLSSSEVNVIRRKLTGPDPEKGAPVFAYFKTKRGKLSQLLYNSVGPLELWAYTSSGADDALRKRLAARIGMRETLEYLAWKFPYDGAARNYIEAEKTKLNAKDDEQDERVYDTVANRLVDEAVERIAQRKAGRLAKEPVAA
jgi:intracellular multiplication protein IcmB